MKGDTMKAKKAKFAQVMFGSLADGDKFYTDDPNAYPALEEWIKVRVCSGWYHWLCEHVSLCTGDWIIYPSKGVADMVWVRVK